MPSVALLAAAGDPTYGVNPHCGRKPSVPNPSANLVGVEGQTHLYEVQCYQENLFIVRQSVNCGLLSAGLRLDARLRASADTAAQ